LETGRPEEPELLGECEPHPPIIVVVRITAAAAGSVAAARDMEHRVPGDWFQRGNSRCDLAVLAAGTIIQP